MNMHISYPISQTMRLRIPLVPCPKIFAWTGSDKPNLHLPQLEKPIPKPDLHFPQHCLNPDGQDLRIYRIRIYICNRENPLIGGIGVQTKGTNNKNKENIHENRKV
jgi:hypothetical protein